MSSQEEKGIAPSTPENEKPPAFDEGTEVVASHARDKEDFRTRNGLNLKSFQRRPLADQDITDGLDAP